MKSILEIDINAPQNKNIYKVRRNCLVAMCSPEQTYHFDRICYQKEDGFCYILSELVENYCEGKKFMCDKFMEGRESKKFCYTILFDEWRNKQNITQFIQMLANLDIFKKQKVQIGHFLINNNNILDYHVKSEQKKFEKTNNSNNISWELKSQQIKDLSQFLIYRQKNQFLLSPNPLKQQIKQFQNQNIIEAYIIKMKQLNIKINLLVINHNRNYQLAVEEKEELKKCFMLYGGEVGAIKYSSIVVEVVEYFLKGLDQMFYYISFPMPKIGEGCKKNLNSTIVNINGSMEVYSKVGNFFDNSTTVSSNFTNVTSKIINTGNRSRVLNRPSLQYHSKYQKTMPNSHKNQNIIIKKVRRTIGNRIYPSQQQQSINLFQKFSQFFKNFIYLKKSTKQQQQSIIKNYLTTKQKEYEKQLEHINERVKQLRSTYMIQKHNIKQTRQKFRKCLSKSLQQIQVLKGMGIKNVEKHIKWINSTVQSKKKRISDLQSQLEQICEKRCESKIRHDYFIGKMKAYQNKLLIRNKFKQQESISLESTLNSQQSCKALIELTQLQLESLEQYRQNLREKMNCKLKSSHEKRQFISNFQEIKGNAGKMQIMKIQQKYYALLQDF